MKLYMISKLTSNKIAISFQNHMSQKKATTHSLYACIHLSQLTLSFIHPHIHFLVHKSLNPPKWKPHIDHSCRGPYLLKTSEKDSQLSFSKCWELIQSEFLFAF